VLCLKPKTEACHHKQKQTLISCAACSSFPLPDQIITTTAAFSQQNIYDFFCHCHPHIAAPITIGNNFFNIMWMAHPMTLAIAAENTPLLMQKHHNLTIQMHLT